VTLTADDLEELGSAARIYAEDGLGTSCDLLFIKTHREKWYSLANKADAQALEMRHPEPDLTSDPPNGGVAEGGLTDTLYKRNKV
jgi:hypothetical protein